MKRLLCFVGLALCLFQAGCIPNVAWLPDSSGFVFTESTEQERPKFRLIHYDIAKKDRRIVVPDLKDAYTTWTAVSPDGKQIAVARLFWQQDQAKVQLIVHGLDGKELKRSKEFDWLKSDKADKGEWLSIVFWGAPTKLLVTGVHKDVATNTGIYDTERDEMIVVPDRFPFIDALTPCRADGKGFLAGRDKSSDLEFIDWSGKTTKLDLRADWIRDNDQHLVDFRWDGAKAIMLGTRESCTVDTNTGAVTFQKAVEVLEPKKPGETLAQLVTFADNRLDLRVFEWMDANTAKHARMEIRDRNTGNARSLVGDQSGLVFPSPDRRWLAIRMDKKILVVDKNGNIAAEVEAASK